MRFVDHCSLGHSAVTAPTQRNVSMGVVLALFSAANGFLNPPSRPTEQPAPLVFQRIETLG